MAAEGRDRTLRNKSTAYIAANAKKPKRNVLLGCVCVCLCVRAGVSLFWPKGIIFTLSGFAAHVSFYISWFAISLHFRRRRLLSFFSSWFPASAQLRGHLAPRTRSHCYCFAIVLFHRQDISLPHCVKLIGFQEQEQEPVRVLPTYRLIRAQQPVLPCTLLFRQCSEWN